MRLGVKLRALKEIDENLLQIDRMRVFPWKEVEKIANLVQCYREFADEQNDKA
jgi:hypothetical protein